MRRLSAVLVVAVVAVAAGGCGGSPGAPGALVQRVAPAACIWSTDGLGEDAGCGRGHGFAEPSSVQVSPDGRHVYAFGASVGVFQRNARTGRLAQSPGRAGCLGEPRDYSGSCLVVAGIGAPLAFSADGRHAYASGPVIFDRERVSGVLRRRAGAAACFSAADTGGRCRQLGELAVGSAPVLSPDGRHLYVLSTAPEAQPSGGVAIFLRDRRTGALTPRPGVLVCRPLVAPGCGAGRARGSATSLAISPDGLNLYVGLNDDGIAVFDRDPRTGALGQFVGGPGCVSATPDVGGCTVAAALTAVRRVVVSPDGRNVYGLSGDPADSVAVLRREPRNGSLTQLRGLHGCISRTGTRDTCTTGGESFRDVADLALSTDGRSAYVVGAGDGGLAVLDRDPATGALAPRAGKAGCFTRAPYNAACTDAPAFGGAAGVAVSPDGANVYVAAMYGDAVAVFDRDRAGRRPVHVAPRTRPYRIFGGPSPATRVAAVRELGARDTLVVRRFARIVDDGWVGDAIVGTSNARLRELRSCLGVWASAPESLGVSELSALYERALAAAGAIERDRGLRRVLARLRAIDGVQRVAKLRAALAVLERQRARVRALAGLYLDTCGLLRQWRAARWRRSRPPAALVRTRRLLRASSRGDGRVLDQAARLLAHNGGGHARTAAQRLAPVTYPHADLPACDPVLNIIDPELVFCE